LDTPNPRRLTVNHSGSDAVKMGSPVAYDEGAAFNQFITHSCLSKCGLLNGELHDCLFNRRINTIFQYRLATTDLNQGGCATLVIEFFESVKALSRLNPMTLQVLDTLSSCSTSPSSSTLFFITLLCCAIFICLSFLLPIQQVCQNIRLSFDWYK
jgi:hypothetical protein